MVLNTPPFYTWGNSIREVKKHPQGHRASKYQEQISYKLCLLYSTCILKLTITKQVSWLSPVTGLRQLLKKHWYKLNTSDMEQTYRKWQRWQLSGDKALMSSVSQSSVWRRKWGERLAGSCWKLASFFSSNLQSPCFPVCSRLWVNSYHGNSIAAGHSQGLYSNPQGQGVTQ